MSTNLIHQFHELSDQIELATQTDDLDSLRKLDQKIVEVRRRILAWRPRNPENIPVLTEFLLDQLISNPNVEHFRGEIRDKILILGRLAYKLGQEANLKR